MNTSLSKFAKDTGLPKSSVYARCKELKLDVAHGLTPAMVSQLEHEFGVKASVMVNEPAAVPVIPTSVEVGNHQMVLAPPQIPQQYSLEGLRTVDAVSFDDPLAVAAQFLQAAEALEVAMHGDLEARRTRLQQTQQAKDAIASQRQKLELEARLYQLEARNLDGSLSAETAALQTELGKLGQFSKAAAAPGASPPSPSPL